MARTAWKCLLVCLIALICSVYFQVVKSAAGDITYIYDELGRFVAVIDHSGDTAIYNYDAVGNLLSITRQSSSLVAVIEFTPDGGIVGSTVTIYGTGFSTISNLNTVTFNGTAATVASSTATKIVTSVPSGATTGPIAVTVSNVTGASAVSFTVASSTSSPTISSFTPTAGPVGTSVTVTGTNFEPIASSNKVKFNNVHAVNSSASATSLTSIVPSQTSSGRISVTTPAGTTLSSGDFFVTPHPFNGSSVVFTDRMAIGDTKVIPVSTSGKIAMVVFDGTQGQQVSFRGTSNSLHPANLFVYKPDGTLLVSKGPILNSDPFIDTQTLPSTGTYTFLASPEGSVTGSITLTLFDVIHVSGSIAVDGPTATTTITTQGQNSEHSFTATAGDQVSFTFTGSTIAQSSAQVIKPDGSLLASVNVFTSNTLIDSKILPVTGTYKIKIDPVGVSTGNMTLKVYSTPDVTGTITPGGSPVAITIPTAGQRARLTFSGTAGQKISLFGNNSTIFEYFVYIKNPDDSTVTSNNTANWVDIFVEPETLTANITYVIEVNPNSHYIGNITLTLYDVIDLSGTISIGGGAVAQSLPTPGQINSLTFSGTSGQQVTVGMTGNSIGSTKVSLHRPDGTQMAMTTKSASIFNLATQTLPTTGTYTIRIDPQAARTGSISVSVTSP